MGNITPQVQRHWFGGDPGRDGFKPDVQRWYFGGEQADKQIKQLFGAQLEHMLQSPGDPAWEVSTDLMIAKVIMLDQFTRSVYRGSPKAFAGDAEALRLANLLMDIGAVETRNGFEVLFAVLMPIMHSESLADHRKAEAVIAQLVSKGEKEEDATLVGMLNQTSSYMAQHTRVLERFGRYPSRNGAIGRGSTPEEVEYLAGELSDWEASQLKN